MGERPVGVTIVAGLMLLAGIGDFFFVLFVTALCSVGGPPTSSFRPSLMLTILVCSPLLLSVFSFVASSGILNGAIYAWYLSFVLWVSSAVYYGFVAVFLFLGNGTVPMVAALILVVSASAVLIIYFRSQRVKNYFRSSEAQQSTAHQI